MILLLFHPFRGDKTMTDKLVRADYEAIAVSGVQRFDKNRYFISKIDLT